MDVKTAILTLVGGLKHQDFNFSENLFPEAFVEDFEYLTGTKKKFYQVVNKLFVEGIVSFKHVKKEEFEAAKAEIEALKQTVLDLQSQLNASKDKIMSLQDEKMTLIEERGKNQLLLELKDKSEKELTETKARVLELEKETQSYQKTIFGLYKKV